MNAFGNGAPSGSAAQNIPKFESPIKNNASLSNPSTAPNDNSTKTDVEDLSWSHAPPSELEIEEKNRKHIVLEYEKVDILESIEKDIKEFDSNIQLLRNNKLSLESDVKFADIKLLLLYQEWVLLKEFEKYDNALAEKLLSKKNEKLEIESKIDDCQEKLSIKKSEIEQIIRREKEIQDEFQRAIGENNKNDEYLTKVFKRKIKRSKKKVKDVSAKVEGEEGEDENEEDEEDSDDDMDASFGSDSETEESEFEEKCPSDFDQVLWNHVLELREQRLDQDDLLIELQKAVEVLKYIFYSRLLIINIPFVFLFKGT